MMKRNWILGFASLFLMAALVVGINTALASRAHHLAPWNFKYILKFHGQQYEVSSNHVTRIGTYLGTISYHGTSSGGYRIYAIPGLHRYSSIAVQTNGGYLIATEKR